MITIIITTTIITTIMVTPITITRREALSRRGDAIDVD